MSTARARVVVESPSGHQMLHFWCPGCAQSHVVSVTGPRPWAWNRSTALPTLTPSIAIRGTQLPTDTEVARILAGERLELPPRVCHSYVTDGRIQYLDDCTHALAGQTVDLPPIADSMGES